MLRRRDDPLREILASSGRGLLDAAAPSVAFVVVWLAGTAFGWPEPILLGGLASVLLALVLAVVRWRGGERPRAAAVGLLLAVGATLIALYTGRAEDFFLPRIVANAGSLAAWLVSIAIRWPLLGLVVGTALGKPKAWRAGPRPRPRLLPGELAVGGAVRWCAWSCSSRCGRPTRWWRWGSRRSC